MLRTSCRAARRWVGNVAVAPPRAASAVPLLQCLGQEQVQSVFSNTSMSWQHGCGLRTSAASLAGRLKPFPLAQTGEGIKECEIVQWFVSEGDSIEAFDRLCEIQSDKATLEITSSMSGIVRKVHFDSGSIVQVGETLVTIETTDDDEDDEDGGDVPAEITTSTSSASSSTEWESEAETDDAPHKVLTSPAVRALARQYDLDLKRVVATGPKGRVTKGDVMAYLDSLQASGPTTVAEEVVQEVASTEAESLPAREAPQVTSVPDRSSIVAPVPSHETTTIPLRGYRKAMVKSMAIAATIPHFHFCEEVQVDDLMRMREILRADPALEGIKLTYMPFFIKAAALALAEYPSVNASLSDDQGSIIQHRSNNIGVAVATPHGLAVPNIKSVEQKSIPEIARELARLQAAAASNQLRPEDIRDGTFTLSNIGTVGGTYATPLVNPPEAAIMALGKLQRVPRFEGPGSLEVKATSILNISLGADHRIVDGATLAGFAQAWKRYVERPSRFLLELR